MSKIICDICGTTYPETAAQCPICGYAKNVDAESVPEDSAPTENNENSGYTYTKGGRFSKSNVKKRNKGVAPAPSYKSEKEPEEEEEEVDEESNRGLIITVILLLLAIAAVIIYIWTRFFSGGTEDPGKPGENVNPGASTSESTSQTTAPTESVTVPCTGMTLSQSTLLLDEAGSAWLLNVTLEPANTTDAIVYASSDPNVATVSASGKVTAVAPGTATITVTCGAMTVSCEVTCNFDGSVTTEPSSEPTSEPTTEPDEEVTYQFYVNGSASRYGNEASIAVGESFKLTMVDSNGNQVDVTWKSKNSSIASVNGTRISGVAKGSTRVTCTIDGETYTFIVRVK